MAARVQDKKDGKRLKSHLPGANGESLKKEAVTCKSGRASRATVTSESIKFVAESGLQN